VPSKPNIFEIFSCCQSLFVFRCHVKAHDWATWWPFIGPRHHLCMVMPCHPYHIRFPHHLLGGCMKYHMAIRIATWHFSIGPWTDRKIPTMSDTWKPLVLPHHHVDVIMTHVILFMFHIPYMDANVIHTYAKVSSTDADSTMLIWLGWPKLWPWISLDL